jgi:very-short-patch-repair endonuclease
MSPPEARLWNILRARPGGFKFRRQHPFGPYVLDFFCDAAGVAVEVDGAVHGIGDNPQRDTSRDLRCSERGVKTLRFAAKDLLHNSEGIVRIIIAECEARAPSAATRSPSPGKPGEES